MMRTLSMAMLTVSGLFAAVPATAQVYYNSTPGTVNAPVPPTVHDPAGPAFHNTPAPGPGVVYDPAGPAYYNTPQADQFIPAPQGGMVSANPPYVQGPQVSAHPPYYNTPRYSAPRGGNGGGRWGGNINGRWWGGMQAPGGWGGYRRPSRGFTLPGYWMSSNFRVDDYDSYGLRAPGRGYFWVRYYDDAVLVDGRGRVWDSASGIGWASASAGGGYGSAYASSSASASASSGGGYGHRPIRQIDPNYGYGYPVGGYAPPAAGAPPAVHVQGYPAACPQVCPGGSYYGNGGYGGASYYGGGGYYGGGSTTVVIQSPPMITTTTTIIEEEVIEEEVVTSYVSRPKRVVRRAPAKRRYKPRPVRSQCGCQCVCR
jgi:Ni/Co efflux regulator RcnB